MSSTQSFLSFAIKRAMACALLAASLLFLSGCGETNPLVELRDEGAEFKRTKQRTVELVRLPKDAGNEELALVAKLDKPQALTMLDLANTQITNEGLKYLEGFTGLETLDLTGTEIGYIPTEEDKKAESSEDQTEAEKAKQEEDAVQKQVDAIAPLFKLENLRDIRIGDTNITPDQVQALVDKLPKLAVLDASGSGNPEINKPEERTWKSTLNFGIDLAGGTNLVYQVDRAKLAEKEEEERKESPEGTTTTTRVEDVMNQMVAAVSRRLNPSGVEEITVRKVGSDRIEIIIPRASPEVVARKKAQMTRLGSLEFALLANARDHADIYEEMRDREDDLLRNGSLRASWRPVGLNANGTPKEIGQGGEVFYKSIKVGGVDLLHFLVVFGDKDDRVTGKYLSRAYETTDENGRLAVGFLFNTQGGFRFQRLTSNNKPKADGFESRLAILLDNNIHSAPSIITTISNQGQITGSFTNEEVQDLIGVLNAGALTVPIQERPISEFSVSALLGAEVQRQGILAILIALGTVLGFMLVYYLFAGLVADMCLLLNIILVMGTMALIDATFTLPGLAGIVLTIGMAVDANVLIFERMREELNRGSSMRLSIQNGFGRALSAIVDANITTLITAVVLYTIGTDQVRGFAVTLFIGIVMSMFTALYFGRMVFEIGERKRWITKLKMLSIVKSDTHWRFISKWKIAVVASTAMIVVGIGTFFARGGDNFDIDFSGGTMLTFELTEEEETIAVREALVDQFQDNTITLEKLTRGDLEESSSTKGRLFRVRSKEQDEAVVEGHVTKALDAAGYSLNRIQMTPKPEEIASEIRPITPDSDTLANEDRRKLGDFDEGHRVTVNFAEGLTRDYVYERFMTEIESINLDGEPVYPRARANNLVYVSVPQAESPTSTDEAFTQVEIWVKPAVDKADFETALAAMQDPRFEGISTFDSSVAGEMKTSAVQAILVSLIAIVAYIWFRFQRITFGLAAVAAVVHDVLAVLGIVAMVSYASSTWGITFLGLEDFKINLPMIAAFLTIVGYSLNDTIVVFDRIREVRGKNPAMTEQMIDDSLNQTMSRTLLTSLTTWFVVAVLYAIGGAGIHGFAFCLVIGVIVGTYSTIYVASPVLLWLMNREGNKPRHAASQPSQTTTTAG